MELGTLYIVSMPIGNLGDITFRAVEILEEVDAVLAEDTRELVKLLQLKNLPRKRTISYRDQIHDRVVREVIGLLAQGQNIALVSDRGTPTISDPGYKLVRDVVQAGYEVVPIPGPTAAMAALSASGLPTDKFIFLGFLPRTAGKQVRMLQDSQHLPCTFIVYESPFRVIKLLENIQTAFGDNVDVVVAREVTKLHEEFIRGTVAEVLTELKSRKEIRGEIVVLGSV